MMGDERLRSLLNFWSNDNQSGIQEIEVSHKWTPAFLRSLERKVLGTLGEKIVSKWAQLAGFSILHHSLRHTGFELDLVIQQRDSIKVLEIKTRLNPFCSPDMNITQGWMNRRKMDSILRGVEFLSRTIPGGLRSMDSINLDLVAIDIYASSQTIRAYRWPNILHG